jgi:hypothetical protein
VDVDGAVVPWTTLASWMMTFGKARVLGSDKKSRTPEKAPAKRTHHALMSSLSLAHQYSSIKSILHAAVCLQGSLRLSGAIGRHALQDAALPPCGHQCKQVTLRGSSPASHGKAKQRVLRCLTSIPHSHARLWRSLPGVPFKLSALRRRRVLGT